MVDILLLHCPPESINFPPLQTAQLATLLEYSGFSCSVIDLNLKLRREGKSKHQSSWLKINDHYWHDQVRLQSFIKENNAIINDLLQSAVHSQAGILYMDLEFPKEIFGCEIIKRIKKELPEIKIIVGGLSTYSLEQQTQLQELSDHIIDHFLTGAATISLPKLLHQLDTGGSLDHADKQPQPYKQRHLDPHSDVNVFPTYKEFELNDYRGRCLSISLGSGCTGTCTFCKRTVHTDRQTLRSISHIVEEISYHVNGHGITHFYLCGTPINSHIQTIEEFCDALVSTGIKISFSAEATAHPSLNRVTLEKLKTAGCHTLIFCTVSGSDTILAKVEAGFSVSDIEDCLQKTNDAGLQSGIRLIAGFPDEHKSEVLETQQLIERNRSPLITAVKDFEVLKIVPGTKLFVNRKQENIQTGEPLFIDRWTCSDGNSFYIRKLMQNQLHYHILKYKLPYNSHDLIVQVPPLNPLKFKDNYREKKYRLYTFYHPWHTYRSDILSKAVINYVWGKTAVVEKNEMDYPVIQGIDNGKETFIGPETVHLDITNHCNFNCIGCWDRSPLIRQKGVNDAYLKKSLSYELITGFIDDLVELGGVRFIKFSGGGEPTMHPRFKDILSYLREKDKYVEIDINTNFSLMNEKLLDLIIDLQVNLLTVSLWAATPEVYVQTHPNQKEEVFNKIVSNLKRITRHPDNKVLKLFLHNVIMSHNHHEIEAMLELALDVNADEIHFTLVDPVVGKTDSLLLSHQEQQEVFASLKRIKPFIDRHNQYCDPQTHRSIQITNFHEFFVKMSQTEIEEGVYDLKAVNEIPCYIGWLYTRIMADGRVVPCCKGHRLPMGNLNKNRFIEIWNGPRYKKFRHNGLTLDKSAPYFSVMGDDGAGRTGCLNCDNIIHNTVMHDKFLCYSNLRRWFVFKMNQWWKKLF